MTQAVRTPYQARKEAAEQFDEALRAVGINASPSRVESEMHTGGVRATRVAPPLLTPTQAARLVRIVEAARR
ncbi:hypothetical protein [Streptomyces sp. NPDC059080]|uniref:hypothetical protein n=1 Tax=Streptomyces sp. NPDC059080 TaxID=3346718 RepID=UPI0036A50BA9